MRQKREGSTRSNSDYKPRNLCSFDDETEESESFESLSLKLTVLVVSDLSFINTSSTVWLGSVLKVSEMTLNLDISSFSVEL